VIPQLSPWKHFKTTGGSGCSNTALSALAPEPSAPSHTPLALLIAGFRVPIYVSEQTPICLHCLQITVCLPTP